MSTRTAKVDEEAAEIQSKLDAANADLSAKNEALLDMPEGLVRDAVLNEVNALYATVDGLVVKLGRVKGQRAEAQRRDEEDCKRSCYSDMLQARDVAMTEASARVALAAQIEATIATLGNQLAEWDRISGSIKRQVQRAINHVESDHRQHDALGFDSAAGGCVEPFVRSLEDIGLGTRGIQCDRNLLRLNPAGHRVNTLTGTAGIYADKLRQRMADLLARYAQKAGLVKEKPKQHPGPHTFARSSTDPLKAWQESMQGNTSLV